MGTTSERTLIPLLQLLLVKMSRLLEIVKLLLGELGLPGESDDAGLADALSTLWFLDHDVGAGGHAQANQGKEGSRRPSLCSWARRDEEYRTLSSGSKYGREAAKGR